MFDFIKLAKKKSEKVNVLKDTSDEEKNLCRDIHGVSQASIDLGNAVLDFKNFLG